MAREKVLYEGHPVAAVAATTSAIARRALKLIDVKYAVLPHVIDVVEAMRPDAPLLHEDLYTAGVEPKPGTPSNVAKRVEISLGDIEAGFKKADVIIEREFKTQPVHQGYIEPHTALATVSEDGSAELWCTTQGHFIVRAHCARLLGMDIARIRVTASEIGGGFGGKTVVYLEPLALALSKKAKRPVKMVMTREEVFKSSGPTSGAVVRVKMGATKDGQFTAGFAELKYQAGAFQGSPVQPGVMCAYAPYDIEHVKVIGYDVVSNRPKVAAYRAPGAPISEFAVESVVDEIAKFGGAAMLAKANLADPQEARAMVRLVAEEFRHLDVLVNNAGITRDALLKKLTDDNWLEVIQTNLNACFFCTSAAIPIMTAQSFGRIINISSMNGQVAAMGQANYSASKGGIIAFTRTAALELAKSGITVNTVSPGYTETDMFAKVPGEIQAQIKAKIPLGRFAQPEEIAKAVIFLIADGDYITGQQINVNGGAFM
jgi:NAD(P)-dependent dehydrogenase (short-subunit alcohol dehydrogenase family)